MDTFEFNKIAGAVLFVLLIIVGIGTVGDILVSPKQLYEPVYKVALPDAEEQAAVAAGPAQPEVAPIPVRLADANVENGMKEAKKCAACHTFEEGGANKVGPNLWGIVGAPKAHLDNFTYSESLAAMGAEWSYEALDEFLADPKAYVPGTKMAFAGVKNPQARADLIAYLRSLSATPLPLPEVPAAADPAAAAQPTSAQPAEAAPAGQSGAQEPEAATAAPTREPAEESAPGPTEQAPAQETPAQQDSSATQPAGQQEAAAAGGEGGSALIAAIAGGDVAAGEKEAKKCVACHTFEKGGANKVGPNLYGIVGAKKAHLDDFRYSDALLALGGTWTYEDLDGYLADPKAFAPGNKMAFVGVKKPEARANLIAWLRTLSDSPAPLQ